MFNRKEKIRCHDTNEEFDFYADYLNSKHWETTRALKFARLRRSNNGLCEVCNQKKAEQVHHISYLNVGNEKGSDLLGVCKRCHTLIHDLVKKEGIPLNQSHIVLKKTFKKSKKKTTKNKSNNKYKPKHRTKKRKKKKDTLPVIEEGRNVFVRVKKANLKFKIVSIKDSGIITLHRKTPLNGWLKKVFDDKNITNMELASDGRKGLNTIKCKINKYYNQNSRELMLELPPKSCNQKIVEELESRLDNI